jgi:ornithine cyclodeaminase/alanine dehydrogenase-like protein (mu-crystallin family)
MYTSKQTKLIAKLFKYTDVKIAYKNEKNSRKFIKSKTKQRGNPIQEKWNL